MMMNRGLQLILIWCLSMPLLQAQSYWERLKAPDGGSPSRVYQTAAGWLYAEFYDHTMYCSTDNGVHWQQIFQPSGDPDTGFVKISVGRAGTLFAERILDPETSLAHLYNTFYSLDNGNTWLPLETNTRTHALGELSDGTWLALRDSVSASSGGYYQFLSRSASAGATWTNLQAWGLGGNYYTLVSIDSYDRLTVSTDYSWFGTFFFSINGGQNGTWWWDNNLLDLPFFTSSGALLVPDNLGGLRRRVSVNDPGQSVLLDSTLVEIDNYVYAFALAQDGAIYASTAKFLFKSMDDGLHWTRVSAKFAGHFPLFSTLQDGSLIGSEMLRSQDGGLSWSFSGYGIDRALGQLCIWDEQHWWSFTQNGLWATENGGQQWNLLDTSAVTYYSTVAADTGSVLYLAKQGAVFRHTAWNQPPIDVTPPGGLAPDFSQVLMDSVSHAVFARTRLGTARSIDGGAHWTPVADSFYIRSLSRHPSGALFALMDSLRFNGDGSYAYSTMLFRSEDGGLHWQRPTMLPFKSLVVLPNGNLCALIFGSRFSRSVDQGQNWSISSTLLGQGLEGNAAGQLFLTKVSGTDRIRMSADQGYHWQSLPLPELPFGNSSGPTFAYGVAVSKNMHLYATGQFYGGYGNIGALYRTSSPTAEGSLLSGQIRVDADMDCSTPDAQQPVGNNWVVKAEGADTWYTLTDENGQYQMFLDTGLYDVTVRTPQDLWWNLCDSTQAVLLGSLNSVDSLHFDALALADCPLLTVELTIPRLRRCFPNAVLVGFCNQGTEPADSAWVGLELDPYLSFVGSNQPHTLLGNGQIRFWVGDVAPGHCGDFSLTVQVDCDSTVLGQTHCITAHGYPDTLCTPVPNWSGAEINAEVTCQDSTLHFELRNTGGALSQVLGYIIIEDDVVLMNGNRQYAPNEAFQLDLPANGHTWRIESMQEPGHPFSTLALAFSEGCGGYNSLGYINQFPVDPFTPSWDQDCLENTDSYDPNDKQGSPIGYSADHIILPGQDLEYLIRFQNTGTDTAYTVLVIDTLSAGLDPASLRPGPASHAYTWSLNGAGEIRFAFDNIFLPDSNTNEAASHGFVSFRVAQKPGLPLGAQIFNSASIYFDFNLPVRTNQTWHTIGQTPTVSAKPAVPYSSAPSEIVTQPQPAGDFVLLSRSDGQAFRQQRLLLSDALGRTLRQVELNGASCRIEREGLAPGLYFFRVEDAQGRLMGQGRMMW
ncbi:MAG: hypothetical protein IT260_00940 [Saprospiraceae bacterium]|nr:hypothetical protein [Saprospiraceae bacterium]